jgi:pimeloyl-ACP methyl ester carboxylesterase
MVKLQSNSPRVDYINRLSALNSQSPKSDTTHTDISFLFKYLLNLQSPFKLTAISNLPTMSTQQTAKTQYVKAANGVTYAYRKLGLSTGVPLLMMIHYRGTMDHWDPALINLLIKQRPVILFDNTGVGKTDGDIPTTFKGWAEGAAAFIEAIHLDKLDLLGFSMGGMSAQMTALLLPEKIRKLVLTGTGPSAYEGAEAGPAWAITLLATPEQPEKDAWTKTFFTLSPEKQAVGGKWWDRINERTEATSGEPRSLYVSLDKAPNQIQSVMSFKGPEEGSFERLGELKMPVFIANGSDDVLVPTSHSYFMFRKIANPHLHLYPDSGHGFLFEYAELFAKHLALFLDEETSKL